jgi:Family of unknown function (DUF6152)
VSSVKRVLRMTSVMALVLAAWITPASAHHSFGRYNMAEISEIEGVVNKFEWSNPHSWLFVDVGGGSEAAKTYGFELQSVGELLRRGWSKTIVKPGEKVKIKFRPLRDGSPAGLLVSAERDGKMVGNPFGPPPAEVPPDAK